MVSRMVPMRVGSVELLVETTAIAGTEPTSRMTDVADRVVEGFEQAQNAIVAMAGSVVTTIRMLEQGARCPDRFEVEFGLKFSATGNVVVASTSGEATLRVLMHYENHRAPGRRDHGT
jgi:hypothetical protein